MRGVEVGLTVDEVRTLVLDGALKLAVLAAEEEALVVALCWWLFCIRKRLNRAKFLLVVQSS